ncbi:MAG: DUF2225 domain-containing protein [Planctomycetota bacterium]
MKICLWIIMGLLAAGISTARGEAAGVEFLYTCKSCNGRFMALMLKAAAPIGTNRVGRPDLVTINGKTYPGTVFKGQHIAFAMPDGPNDELDSDMGFIPDDFNQYNYAVIICPRCGFAFLPEHFDQLAVPEAVQRLVQTNLAPVMEAVRRSFVDDVTKGQAFREQITKQKDGVDPRRLVLTSAMQNQIPAHIKFDHAIACYRWLNYQPAFISRLALNGAWAYRTEVCLPFETGADVFQQAVVRVEDLTAKYAAELQRMAIEDPRGRNTRLVEVLETILDKGKLGDVERFVTCNMLIGLCDRLGRFHAVRFYLDQARAATGGNERLALYIAKKVAWLDLERKFLQTARQEKMAAFAAGNIVRGKVFTETYLLGELCKRQGNLQAAAFWFNAVAALADAPPELKELCSRQAADVAALAARWAPGEPVGAAERTLAQDLNEGLGTAAFFAARGLVQKGLDPATCEKVMRRIGNAVLVYMDDNGFYPDGLQDLWENDLLQPQSVNSFCCPVTGLPYIYIVPQTGFAVWPLLCDRQAHTWADAQPRWGVYRSGHGFSVDDSVPGEIRP